MKANLVVAEMDPSRVDVACRAVTHELMPFFQAQRGAGSAYWMVDRTTGDVLVLTTWDDEDALAAVRATDGRHRARVGGRTGLVVRSITSMDVVESDDAGLTSTASSRWARAMWTGLAARDRRAGPGAERAEVVAVERHGPVPCGAYRLSDAATGAGLTLRFWDRPPAEPDSTRTGNARGRRPFLDIRVADARVAELQGLGVVARAQAR